MENKIELFRQPETDYVKLNQGVFNGQYYFGKVVNVGDGETSCVIFSDRKAYIDYFRVDEGKNEIGVVGIHSKDQLQRVGTYWSNASIDQFLNGNAPKIEIIELFHVIREQYETYMDVPDERILDLVTAYTIGTYCHCLFDAYGYLFFNSEKESGKTKFMRLMELVCFNSINATNPSESSLFRLVHQNQPTFFIDDYEGMDPLKQRSINSMLKIGYKKGGQTSRTESRRSAWVTTLFDLYSPKVISNTEGLEEITLTRCIPIRLFKTRSDKGRLSPKMDERWQDLRDSCYIAIMQNWEEIQSLYEHYNNERLNNRDLETSKGLLSIAMLVGTDVHDGIVDYLLEAFDQRDISDVEDLDHMLWRRIKENVKEDRYYKIDEIHGWVKGDIKTEGQDLKKWIGKRLSRGPFHKRRVERVQYAMSPSLVKKYIESKGYFDLLGETG